MSKEPITNTPALRRAALLLAVIAGLALAAPARAAEPETKLPPDLDLVPRNAAGFVHLRLADIWKSELMTDLRQMVNHAGPEALAAFEKQCPVPPAALDRITLLMMTPRSMGEPFPEADPEAVSALVIVHTTKPYDRLTLRQALGYREKVARRQLYYFNEDLWSGLYLIDEQTFLIGSEDALIQYFDALKESKKDGPLQSALEAAAGKHHVVVGLNPSVLAREPAMQSLPQPLQPLLEGRSGIITLDVAKGVSLKAQIDYGTEDQAKAGEKAVRAALELARGGLAEPIGQLEKQLFKDKDGKKPDISNLSENAGLLVGLGFMRELEAVLKDAPVDLKGSTVQFALTKGPFESNQANFLLLSFGSISMLGRSASAKFNTVAGFIGASGQADPAEAHMRQLSDALERYHKDKGSYPPPALYDKDGRPVLSWRVALLPYLNEEVLYKEFHLDEPWDSLHNKKLIKKLPKCFNAPNSSWQLKNKKTRDLVFTGSGTVFEGPKGVRKADVDGKTVLLIMAGSNQAVYWTKPADLTYHGADKPLPELFDRWGGGQVRVMLTDGTLRTLNNQLGADKELRDLIPRTKKSEKPEK